MAMQANIRFLLIDKLILNACTKAGASNRKDFFAGKILHGSYAGNITGQRFRRLFALTKTEKNKRGNNGTVQIKGPHKSVQLIYL